MEGLKQLLQPKECKLAEIDPEDSYHSIDTKVKKTQDVVQDTMGPSQLRRNISRGSDSIQHLKYAGRLVSVKEWMKTDTELDAHQSINRDEHDSDDEIEQFDDEDLSNLEEDEDEDDDKVDGDGDEDEEQQEEEDDNEEAEQRGSQSSASSSGSRDEDSKQKPGQPSDLIKQLQVSAKADIEKAKAVKNQLAMYDRILAVRIGIQKSLVATNKLVEMKSQVETGQQEQEDDGGVKDQAQIAIDRLLEIGSKISTLRATFMEPIDGEPPRKRQKSNEGDRAHSFRDCLEENEQLDKRLSTYLQTTVRKWSTKINSTTAINTKKFDSNSKQNTMDQLQKTWTSKEEKEKLILRSRTNKQRHNLVKDINSDKPTIFEDRDFYLSLLKDVVDSAARKQDMAEESMITNNDYRAHRVHRENVDPKATKGRKIRYNIHDKLVSIMVPIQNELWTDEQRDELFASLFGFGFDNQIQDHDSHPFSLSKSDGFKLF